MGLQVVAKATIQHSRRALIRQDSLEQQCDRVCRTGGFTLVSLSYLFRFNESEFTGGNTQ
jgi:hypothetical protein